MQHRRVVLRAIPLVLALLGSTEARADEGTIVCVHSSKGSLDARLSAELSTLGFVVKDIEQVGPNVDLDQIARANGAAAAVRVDKDDAIELWVIVPGGRQPPIHEIIPVDPHRGWNLAAVSALETLRAHLLRVHRDAEPVPQDDSLGQKSAPKPTRAAPRRSRLWVHVAGGAEASAGGLGPAAEILGEGRFEVEPRLSVSAFGMFTPVSVQVEGPEGVASVRHAMVGAAADGQMALGGVTGSLGLGAIVAFFSMSGHARAPGYAGQDASIVTLGPVLRACASIGITPDLRVRTEAMGGVTAPHAVILFAGREIADWGRPFGLVTLGLEWGAL